MADAAFAGLAAEDANPLKRKAVEDVDTNVVDITPLGSGNEVGRSCHIIRFKGKTVMLDCGIHPAYSGLAGLPFLDEVELKDIDLLLISHFHLDHIAALPYLLEKTDFKGKVYMTHPTKSIYKLIIQDYVKVSTISVSDQLYTEQDLINSMKKITTINFHEVVHYKGIKFWCYNAGHVLGAAMFEIEIAGVKILYTGDYSRSEDRHLMAAEVPQAKNYPDILICEATYGVQRHRPVQERERRFTELVDKIVSQNLGRCLIPVFALGRAQELLLILDEYWAKHKKLHNIPILYAGALANKCMKVYQTFSNMMNERIRKQSQLSNPFVFQHVHNLKGIDDFDDSGPCVVMASPGMLQNGLSRELFEAWCSDPSNGCIIPGYCVDGTLAYKLMTEPETITSLQGLSLPVKMEVHYISFSAHADFAETSEFIDILKPPYVVLVHGESNQMARLQQALQRTYTDGSVQISAPQNCQTVSFSVRRRKELKIVGGLASVYKQSGNRGNIAGLLVRRNYTYHLMNTTDLSKYTALSSTTFVQRLTVPYSYAYDTLVMFLGQVYELRYSHTPTSSAGSSSSTGTKGAKTGGNTSDTLMGPAILVAGKVCLRVRKSEARVQAENTGGTATSQSTKATRKSNRFAARKKVKAAAPSQKEELTSVVASKAAHHADVVELEWQSNPVTDMLADSVVSLIMSMQSSPGVAKAMTNKPRVRPGSVVPSVLPELRHFLVQHFGQVEYDESVRQLRVHVPRADVDTDETTVAVVDARTLEVNCDDPAATARVGDIVSRVLLSIQPLSV